MSYTLLLCMADDAVVEYGRLHLGRKNFDWDNAAALRSYDLVRRKRSSLDREDSNIPMWWKKAYRPQDAWITKQDVGMSHNAVSNQIQDENNDDLDKDEGINQDMPLYIGEEAAREEYEGPDQSILWEYNPSRQNDMRYQVDQDDFVTVEEKTHARPRRLQPNFQDDPNYQMPYYMEEEPLVRYGNWHMDRMNTRWEDPNFMRYDRNRRKHIVNRHKYSRSPKLWMNSCHKFQNKKRKHARIVRQGRDWKLNEMGDRNMKRDNIQYREANLQPCDEEKLMTYLAQLQAINPESVVQLSAVKDSDPLCSQLGNNLDSVDTYLKTCEPPTQPDLYLKLIQGVRTLRYKLCLDSVFQAEFNKHAPCLSQLRNDFESCIGPADWPENPDDGVVCKVYRDIYNCYFAKSSYLCGSEAANIIKCLTKAIIDSVLTVKCDIQISDATTPATMYGKSSTESSFKRAKGTWFGKESYSRKIKSQLMCILMASSCMYIF